MAILIAMISLVLAVLTTMFLLKERVLSKEGERFTSFKGGLLTLFFGSVYALSLGLLNHYYDWSLL